LRRPLSSKVIGHANIKITERNATLTREHFQVIQIRMPTRKQLFDPSQLAHPQSSINGESNDKNNTTNVQGLTGHSISGAISDDSPTQRANQDWEVPNSPKASWLEI